MNSWCEWREAEVGELAVIGDPIAHSWSPRIFAAAGIREAYRAIRVPPAELRESIHHLVNLGYQGLNVTLPLKELAFQGCATTDADATRIRAINTLNLQTGEGTNTDHLGFEAALRAHPLVNGRAVVLGAGGSSRAVLIALERMGFDLAIWNRTPNRAIELVQELGIQAVVLDSHQIDSVDLVVNATASKFGGDPLPILWPASSGLAFDLSYSQEPTAFLESAARAGWQTCDGRKMLVEQARASYHWWTGQWLDSVPMEQALNNL